MSNDVEFQDFVTNDMAIVAFLKMQGHSPQETFMESSVCTWRFYILGNLRNLVEDFVEDRATVNPREYNKFFAQVKRDMYRAMGNSRD